MSKIKDLTGQRFGKLVAIEPTEERRNGRVVWRCRCDCGGEKLVQIGNLLNGGTKSCGCERGKKPKDLAGQRFGKLTAIESTEERRGSFVVWRCKCDCGNEKLVPSSDLISGHTKTCGCDRGSKPKDITAQRFGKLTVIEPTENRRDGQMVWKCRCDCGNEKLVATNDLVGGRTKSCGCIPRGSQKKDLTGKRFGKLTAIEAVEERQKGRVIWRCLCDCGNEAFVSSSKLISGETKSCGCYRRSYRPKKELAGKRFDMLTVIEETGKRTESGLVVWRCRCDCGNEWVYANSLELTTGLTHSCGCEKELKGKKFGKLTAIEQIEKQRYRNLVVWRCLCDCGKEKLVPATYLTCGLVKSCGCLKKEITDLTGQRFGKLTVIEYDEEKKKWKCRCDCGGEKFAVISNLVNGHIKSCGCLRRKTIKPEEIVFE